MTHHQLYLIRLGNITDEAVGRLLFKNDEEEPEDVEQDSYDNKDLDGFDKEGFPYDEDDPVIDPDIPDGDGVEE